MNKYWCIFIIFVRIVCTSAQDANCDWLASDTLAISGSPVLVPEVGCAMSQTITVSNNEILIVTGEKRESPFAQLTTGFETETAATYCSADWTGDAACADNSAYAPDVSCYVESSLLDCQTTCANILSCNGVSYDDRNWCLFCKSSSKDLASSFTSHANWNTYWKLRNRHFHVKVNAILRISYLTLMGGKVSMNVAKPNGYGGSILIDGRWCDNDVLYGGTTACGTSVNTNEGDQPIVVLSSVVLQGNQAKKGGGLSVLYYGDLTLTNVIFDGNIAEGVTVTDISATNFVTNGDFSNGLTGWTIPSSKLGRSVGVYSAGVVRNNGYHLKENCGDDNWGGIKQELVSLSVGSFYSLTYEFVGGDWDTNDIDIVRVQVGTNVWYDHITSDASIVFKTATHEFIATTSSMTLSFFTNETNCIDISNVVVQDISTNLGSGGGLFAESLEIDDVGVKIRMTTTTFKNNQAKVGSGGGMFAKGSGVAINMYGGQNKFTDNQAHANCVSAVGGISLQPDHPCSNIDGLWQGGYKIPQYRYSGIIFQKITAVTSHELIDVSFTLADTIMVRTSITIGANPTDSWSGIFMAGQTGGCGNLYIGIVNYKIQFGVQCGTATAHGGSPLQSQTVVVANTEYEIEASYNGVIATLTINGVQEASAAKSFDFEKTISKLNLGSGTIGNSGHEPFFFGSIHKIKLYSQLTTGNNYPETIDLPYNWKNQLQFGHQSSFHPGVSLYFSSCAPGSYVKNAYQTLIERKYVDKNYYGCPLHCYNKVTLGSTAGCTPVGGAATTDNENTIQVCGVVSMSSHSSQLGAAGTAAKAVDGIREWKQGSSMSFSSETNDNWFVIDLGKVRSVAQVVIVHGTPTTTTPVRLRVLVRVSQTIEQAQKIEPNVGWKEISVGSKRCTEYVEESVRTEDECKVQCKDTEFMSFASGDNTCICSNACSEQKEITGKDFNIYQRSADGRRGKVTPSKGLIGVCETEVETSSAAGTTVSCGDNNFGRYVTIEQKYQNHASFQLLQLAEVDVYEHNTIENNGHSWYGESTRQCQTDVKTASCNGLPRYVRVGLNKGCSNYGDATLDDYANDNVQTNTVQKCSDTCLSTPDCVAFSIGKYGASFPAQATATGNVRCRLLKTICQHPNGNTEQWDQYNVVRDACDTPCEFSGRPGTGSFVLPYPNGCKMTEMTVVENGDILTIQGEEIVTGNEVDVDVCAAVQSDSKPCCWAAWDNECSKEHNDKEACNDDGVTNEDEGTFLAGIWCEVDADDTDDANDATTSGKSFTTLTAVGGTTPGYKFSKQTFGTCENFIATKEECKHALTSLGIITTDQTYKKNEYIQETGNCRTSGGKDSWGKSLRLRLDKVIQEGFICEASSPPTEPPQANNYIKDLEGQGEGEWYFVNKISLNECSKKCNEAATWKCEYFSHKNTETIDWCYLHQSCVNKEIHSDYNMYKKTDGKIIDVCKKACDSVGITCDAYSLSAYSAIDIDTTIAAGITCTLFGQNLILDATNDDLAGFVLDDNGATERVIGGNQYYGTQYHTDDRCYMRTRYKYNKESGACRGKEGRDDIGVYLSKAQVGASNCKIACDSLVACDAYDVSTANGWCDLWGMQLVLDANNNKIAGFVRSASGGNKVIGGNRFYGANFHTDNNCYMKIKSAESSFPTQIPSTKTSSDYPKGCTQSYGTGNDEYSWVFNTNDNPKLCSTSHPCICKTSVPIKRHFHIKHGGELTLSYLRLLGGRAYNSILHNFIPQINLVGGSILVGEEDMAGNNINSAALVATSVVFDGSITLPTVKIVIVDRWSTSFQFAKLSCSPNFVNAKWCIHAEGEPDAGTSLINQEATKASCAILCAQEGNVHSNTFGCCNYRESDGRCLYFAQGMVMVSSDTSGNHQASSCVPTDNLAGAKILVGDSEDAYDVNLQQCGADIPPRGVYTGSLAHATHTRECNLFGRYIFVRLPQGSVVPLSLVSVNVFIDGELYEEGVAAQSSVASLANSCTQTRVPYDVSTFQPARSGPGIYEAGTPASKAVDGDFGRAHPNQYHSAELVTVANFVDYVWWGVELKVPVTEFTVKFYARDCCTERGYGGELSLWMGNDWPGDNTNWNDWSQKSSAVLCKIFLVTDSATVDITCVGTTSYTYIFVRPTKIGTHSSTNTYIHIPEITITAYDTRWSCFDKQKGFCRGAGRFSTLSGTIASIDDFGLSLKWKGVSTDIDFLTGVCKAACSSTNLCDAFDIAINGGCTLWGQLLSTELPTFSYGEVTYSFSDFDLHDGGGGVVTGGSIYVTKADNIVDEHCYMKRVLPEPTANHARDTTIHCPDGFYTCPGRTTTRIDLQVPLYTPFCDRNEDCEGDGFCGHGVEYTSRGTYTVSGREDCVRIPETNGRFSQTVDDGDHWWRLDIDTASGSKSQIGGAIAAVSGAAVTLTDTLFSFNGATDSGGAIASLSTSEFTITTSKFENNNALDGYGGAFFATDGASITFEGKDNSFANNNAPSKSSNHKNFAGSNTGYSSGENQDYIRFDMCPIGTWQHTPLSISSYSSNACADSNTDAVINSKNECEAAAKILTLKWFNQDKTESDSPKGCQVKCTAAEFEANNDQLKCGVHWNTDAVGAASADARVVCTSTTFGANGRPYGFNQDFVGCPYTCDAVAGTTTEAGGNGEINTFVSESEACVPCPIGFYCPGLYEHFERKLPCPNCDVEGAVTAHGMLKCQFAPLACDASAETCTQTYSVPATGCRLTRTIYITNQNATPSTFVWGYPSTASASSSSTFNHMGSTTSACSGVAYNCPAQMLDNNLNTVWHCEQRDTCWISFDLGQRKKCNKIKVVRHTESNRFESTYIQSRSSTTAAWSNVFEIVIPTGNTDREVEIAIPLTDDRYYRFNNIKVKSGISTYPALAEVQFKMSDADQLNTVVISGIANANPLHELQNTGNTRHINAGTSSVILRHLRLTGGTSQSLGGFFTCAIKNECSLLAESVIFDGRMKTYNYYGSPFNHLPKHGGAIYSKGDVILNSCEFYNFTATERGGAVYLDSTESEYNISDTTFVGNHAQFGGAIAVQKGNILRLNGGYNRFLNNVATGTSKTVGGDSVSAGNSIAQRTNTIITFDVCRSGTYMNSDSSARNYINSDFNGCENTCQAPLVSPGLLPHIGIESCILPCVPGQYIANDGTCTPMTHANCISGTSWSSATTLGTLFGSLSDDGVCTDCDIGKASQGGSGFTLVVEPQAIEASVGAVVTQGSATGTLKNALSGIVNTIIIITAPGNFFVDTLDVIIGETGSSTTIASITISAIQNHRHCWTCQSGRYTNETSTGSCSLCPAGRNLMDSSDVASAHDDISDCAACPQLTYNPIDGHDEDCFPCLTARTTAAVECSGCEPGKKKVTDDCFDCVAGKYTDKRNQAFCKDCSRGKYGETDGMKVCTNCERGKFGYGAGGSDTETGGCKNCPAGTFGDTTGVVISTGCKFCQAGYWSNVPGIQKESQCKSCIAGRYSSAAESQRIAIDTCLPCLSGRYSMDTAAISMTQCLACPKGYFQNVNASVYCLPCQPGRKASNIATAICSECDLQKFAEKTGASSCENCSAGTVSSKGSASCLSCIPGKFQENEICEMCPTGWVSEKSSSTACSQCATGSGTKNESGSTVCIDCIVGRYGKGCLLCPIGYKRSDTDPVSHCVQCSNGTVAAIGKPECLNCIPGKFVATISNICSICPVGWISENPAATACTECKQGSETSNETLTTGAATCQNCDLGKYGHAPGKCNACLPGTYNDAKGMIFCKPCPIDTFYSENGATALSQCEFCPKDRSTGVINGSTTNTSCLCRAFDYFQDNKGSIQCTDCPNGAVCPIFGSNSTDLYAKNGYWQPSRAIPEFLKCSDALTDMKLAALATLRCCPKEANCQTKNKTWTTDDQCALGYAGPLCLACATNFVSFGDDCIPCAGGSPFKLGLAGLGGIAFLVYIVTLIILFKTKKPVEEVEEDITSRIGGLVSIIVSWLQILSALTVTYKLAWPEDFTTYSKGAGKIVNLELFSLLAVSSCSLSVPFTDRFLLQMLTPPFFIVAVVLAWLTMRICGKHNAQAKERLLARGRQSQKIIMLVIQLMYPKLATRTFQMFRCQEVKHVGLVLDQDFSMYCWKGDHVFYATIAFVSVFVYLIGVPLFTFTVLFCNRHRLHEAAVEQRFGDLYRPYEEEWPYWEVALQFQKCILTGAMCAIEPGSPKQLLIAMLACLAYMLLILHAGPYKGNLEDSLAFGTSLCLTVSLMFGFALITDYPETPNNAYDPEPVFQIDQIGILLIVLNVLPFLYFMYAAIVIVKYGPLTGMHIGASTPHHQKEQLVPKISRANRIGNRPPANQLNRQKTFDMIGKAVNHDKVTKLQLGSAVAKKAAMVKILERKTHSDNKLRHRLAARRKSQKNMSTTKVIPVGPAEMNALMSSSSKKTTSVLPVLPVSVGPDKLEHKANQSSNVNIKEWTVKAPPESLESSNVNIKEWTVKAPPVPNAIDAINDTAAATNAFAQIETVHPEVIDVIRLKVQQQIGTEDKLKNIYHKLDTDHDGMLSKKEFKKLIGAVVKPAPTKVIFKAIWLDACHLRKSGDGKNELDVDTLKLWIFHKGN